MEPEELNDIPDEVLMVSTNTNTTSIVYLSFIFQIYVSCFRSLIICDNNNMDNVSPYFFRQIKEVKELVDDAVEYHNNPHIQPLMTTDCTEMRGAQDAVMMITALEDANLVQYKVKHFCRTF